MPSARNIAAAINLRVRQLEKQGIRGPLLINHMLGHMGDHHWLWTHTTDAELARLCRDFPAFHRYAVLMEGFSASNEAMRAADTHPYSRFPELPEALKPALMDLMRAGVELEASLQAVIDGDRAPGQVDRLCALRQAWIDDRARVSSALSAEIPAESHSLIDQILDGMIRRIEDLCQATGIAAQI